MSDQASAPRVVIVLELERAPQIVVDAQNDGEVARLRDWLEAHQEIADLYHQAVEIETDWRERAA